MVYRKAIPPISELREITQKAKKNRHEWNYIIHRKISIYITWLLLHSPISANQVTLLSIFLGVCGFIWILVINRDLKIIGFLLFYLYFYLDKVDGEIARYYKQESIKGICLDYIGHLIVPPLIPLSIGAVLSNDLHSGIYLVIGALTSIAVIFIRVCHDIPLSLFFKKYALERKLFTNIKSSPIEHSKSPHKRGFVRKIISKSLSSVTQYWMNLTIFFVGSLFYFYGLSFGWVLNLVFLFNSIVQISFMIFNAYTIYRNVDASIKSIVGVIVTMENG